MMPQQEKLDTFKKLIWKFYKEQGRSFDWRNVDDPYQVVVSEIMLQQTQTGRVQVKYPSFVQQFPGFKELAAASLRDVLGQWQGLGYNRRAKYLHESAKKIVAHYDGQLPSDQDLLVQLPGIGSKKPFKMLKRPSLKCYPKRKIRERLKLREKMKKSVYVLLTLLVGPSNVSIGAATKEVISAEDLVHAAASGDLQEVDRLLKAGADPNAGDEFGGFTPLMMASTPEIVTRLLKAGADLNTFSKNDQTVLMEAISQGHPEVVAKLLEAGADPNVTDKRHGATALMKATGRGDYDPKIPLKMVTDLLKAGADPSKRDNYGKTALDDANTPHLKALLEKAMNKKS